MERDARAPTLDIKDYCMDTERQETMVMGLTEMGEHNTNRGGYDGEGRSYSHGQLSTDGGDISKPQSSARKYDSGIISFPSSFQH